MAMIGMLLDLNSTSALPQISKLFKANNNLHNENDDFTDDDSPDCDLEHIDGATNGHYKDSDGNQLSICEFATNNCDPGGNYNFFTFYYCTLSKYSNTVRNLIFVPFGCFMMFIFMYLLSDTADEYMSPALERLTTAIGIS